MRTDSYAVTIYVDVDDKAAVFAAALQHMVDECQAEEADARETLAPDGEIDIGNCLRMLLDPGSLCEGAEIQDSSAEHTFASAPDEEDEA